METTTNQRSIFEYLDVTAQKHGGNRESVEAHDSIRSDKARLRRLVHDYITAAGPTGATCEEVSLALDMRYTTVSGRLSELKADGLIVPSGERRPTESGRQAAVLVAAL